MGQRGMRRTNYSPLYHFLPLYHSKHTAQLRNRISMESSKKKCHMSKVHASNFCIALSFLMRINLTKPPFRTIFQSIHPHNVPKKLTICAHTQKLSYHLVWRIFCGFFTLVLVVLRTGCGIVEHLNFLQRIRLYRINWTLAQPKQSNLQIKW